MYLLNSSGKTLPPKDPVFGMTVLRSSSIGSLTTYKYTETQAINTHNPTHNNVPSKPTARHSTARQKSQQRQQLEEPTVALSSSDHPEQETMSSSETMDATTTVEGASPHLDPSIQIQQCSRSLFVCVSRTNSTRSLELS